MKETLSQFERVDQDGVMATCAFGSALQVPPAYVCTVALTTPKGKHTGDRVSSQGGQYLHWYEDGGFVVTAGLTRKDATDLITVLQLALALDRRWNQEPDE